MQVSPIRLIQRIQILQLSHIVDRHDAVGNGHGIALHAALVVASHQPVYIELGEEIVLLLINKHILDYGLFDANQPRHERVHHEFYRHVLDVVEGRPLKVLHHVRRDTEDSAYLLDAELAG